MSKLALKLRNEHAQKLNKQLHTIVSRIDRDPIAIVSPKDFNTLAKSVRFLLKEVT